MLITGGAGYVACYLINNCTYADLSLSDNHKVRLSDIRQVDRLPAAETDGSHISDLKVEYMQVILYLDK